MSIKKLTALLAVLAALFYIVPSNAAGGAHDYEPSLTDLKDRADQKVKNSIKLKPSDKAARYHYQAIDNGNVQELKYNSEFVTARYAFWSYDGEPVFNNKQNLYNFVKASSNSFIKVVPEISGEVCAAVVRSHKGKDAKRLYRGGSIRNDFGQTYPEPTPFFDPASAFAGTALTRSYETNGILTTVSMWGIKRVGNIDRFEFGIHKVGHGLRLHGQDIANRLMFTLIEKNEYKGENNVYLPLLKDMTYVQSIAITPVNYGTLLGMSESQAYNTCYNGMLTAYQN